MIRSQRIIRLIELLTTNKDGITAKKLAALLNVSERTIFRDIKTLRLENFSIDVCNNSGFFLNTQNSSLAITFKPSEIEALSLGAQWVATHGDEKLQKQAKKALSKLYSMQPFLQQSKVFNQSLLIAPKKETKTLRFIDIIKSAIEDERKIKVKYIDLSNKITLRNLWPFALAYYENNILLIAWCESRNEFRHFRCDRFDTVNSLSTKYPNTRIGLYQLWMEKQINAQRYDKN